MIVAGLTSGNRFLTHYFLMVMFLVLISPSLSGQSSGEIKSIFTEAESVLLYNEDYELALPLYLMLTDMVPENCNYQYKVGLCYLNIPGKVSDAIPFLKKAIERTTEDYSYSYKEDHAPIDAIFYLGSAYHILNRTDEAVQYYQEFLTSASYNQLYFMDFVRQQILNCSHAVEFQQKPINIRSKPLDSKINAYRRNTLPVLSGDGNLLVYTALPGTAHRIMVSHRSRKGWTVPEDITDALNAGDDCNATGLSMTGDSLLLYKEEGGRADIWISVHRDSGWSKINRLGRDINTKYWESSASFSRDGEAIYFSSNRDGGYGGLDIYVAHKQRDGQWGNPVNMGPVINTPMMEDYPYVSMNGRRLYFSSQGHYNMGGFDIFYSEKTPDGKWTAPVNLGYPVNTTDDNIQLYPVDNGETVLLSVVSTTGIKGLEDIYTLTFVPEGTISYVTMKGRVSVDGDVLSDPLLKVEISELKTDKLTTTVHPEPTDGTWSADVIPGQYAVTVSAPSFKPTREEVNITNQFRQPFMALETHLQRDDNGKGDVFFVKSLYFDSTSSQLDTKTKAQLNQLVVMLKEYPALQFEVAGTTDTSKNANQGNIASGRAREVVDFLSSQGISKDRFTIKSTASIGVVPIGKNAEQQTARAPATSRRVDIRLLRTDTTFRYKPEMFVPEYLENKNHLTFSILMLKLNKKLPPDYFYRYNIEELNYVKVDEVSGTYYYTLGSFKTKYQAIDMLGKLNKIGFRQASIIDDPALNQLLNRPDTKPTQFIERSVELEEIPYYTIQVYALIKNKPYPGAFHGARDIHIWPCTDGFVRYTIGNYQGWSVALKDMERIKKLGFRDAFIRPVAQLNQMVLEK